MGRSWRFILSALLGIVACNSKSRFDASSAPHVAFDEAEHDFGDVLQGAQLTHAFRLRNTGSAPLRVEGVGHSFSCSGLNPPDVIGPGESADLRVACDTDGRQGPMLDKIVIRSNDPLAPELALQIRASIEPLLAFTERTVDLKVAFGETQSQEVRLSGRLSMEARIEVESVDPPGPDVAVIPASEGKPQGLRLTLHGAQVGRVAGQVVVTTGLSKPPDLTLLYSWQVIGNVTVDPTNPVIDLYATGPAEVSVRVSSRRGDFRLDAAEVIEGPFEATFARDDATRGYVVHVRAVASRIPQGQRGSLGTLRLVSNDPAEPHKDVPLFALGGFR